MTPTIDDKVDQFEAIMVSGYPMVECTLQHFFLPGLYLRTILMPQNSWISSLIHNTVHPFFIRKGKVSVHNTLLMQEDTFEAGHMGVTTPGTRRLLYIHESTEWTTIHPLSFITGMENDLSDEEKLKLVGQIEDLIIEEHINPFLGGVIKNNVISDKQKGGMPSVLSQSA